MVRRAAATLFVVALAVVFATPAVARTECRASEVQAKPSPACAACVQAARRAASRPQLKVDCCIVRAAQARSPAVVRGAHPAVPGPLLAQLQPAPPRADACGGLASVLRARTPSPPPLQYRRPLLH